MFAKKVVRFRIRLLRRNFLAYHVAAGVFVCFLACFPAFAQMAPLPSDPSELTQLAELITDGHQRLAALQLLQRARWNYNLHADGGAPYTMKVSLTATGQSDHDVSGTMEDSWASRSSWSWKATFAGATQVRQVNGGMIYGSTDPVPMRIQMARSALFWPIIWQPENNMIRSAKVKYQGRKITCLLVSGSVAPQPAPRFWVETEYCVDPTSGLLQMWSEAPGVYTVYDYTDAIDFHGHIIPRNISVNENGSSVLRIRVASIEDAIDAEPKTLEPTTEMIAQGPSFTSSMPSRFPMVIDPDPMAPAWIQPVIVHATVSDYDGQVLEAEALQNSDRKLADAAVELVKNTSFTPWGMQREVFVNVQFHRPEAYSAEIFFKRVRRVVLDKKRTVSRPPHRGHPPVLGGRFIEEAGDRF